MPPKNDFDRLFDQLEAITVGFGPVFRDFHSQNNNYPPHNIVRISDNEFYIELALAGFKKSEVTLEEHQGLLTVKGEKSIDPSSTYQFRGIANRSFSKQFRIAEFFDVGGAEMEDGILTISFIKNVPLEAQPKLITIK